MKPVVSVLVITYNQQEYIEQTIRSITNQITSFKFEILVGDDCSMDETGKILQSLAKEFPNLKPILRTQNLGIVKNFMDLYNRAESDFVASMGGDDYWIDTMKLQKTYDFLISNEAYGLVGTAYKKLYSNKNKFEEVDLSDRDVERKELYLENPITAPTVMYKKSLIPQLDKWFEKVPVEDWILWNMFAEVSKVRILSDVTTVYRIHDNSVYSGISQGKRLLWRFNVRKVIQDRFSKESDQVFLLSLKGSIPAILADNELKKDQKKNFLNQLQELGYKRKIWISFLLNFNSRLSNKIIWEILK